MVPKVLRGNRKCEYIPYPPDVNEDSIYIKKRKVPVDSKPLKLKPLTPRGCNNGRGQRKRGREDRNYTQAPKRKRQKTNPFCTRCQNTGHVASKCYANHKYIGINPRLKNMRCVNCGMENNHRTIDCRKPRKYSETICFAQYGSKSNPTNDKSPELNAIQSPLDPQYIANNSNNWHPTTIPLPIHKWMPFAPPPIY